MMSRGKPAPVMSMNDLFQRFRPSSASSKPPPASLAALPVEILVMIFEPLLPDREIIKPRVIDTKCMTAGPSSHMVDPMWGPGLLRTDGEKCHVAILRVDKRLGGVAFDMLYNRTFQIIVSAKGTEFLLWHFARSSRSANVTPRDYHPYSRFPFHKIRALRVSIWPADLEYLLFHIQEEIMALCKYLQWGEVGLEALEIEFARGSGWIMYGSYGDPVYHFYSSRWAFSSAWDSTKTGNTNVALLMEPFTYLRGVKNASVILPKYHEESWCKPGWDGERIEQILQLGEDSGEPDISDDDADSERDIAPYLRRIRGGFTCPQVIDIAEASRQAILQPGPRNLKAMDAMFKLSASWFSGRLPSLRKHCHRNGSYFPINTKFFRWNDSPKMVNCMCEGGVLGSKFEVYNDKDRRLGYPSRSKEHNEKFGRPETYEHPTIVLK